MKYLLVGLIDNICVQSGMVVAQSALVKQEPSETDDGWPDSAATFFVQIVSGMPGDASIIRRLCRHGR